MTVIILAFAALALFDLPPLIIRKEWKTLAITCTLLAAGLALSLTYYITRDVKSPIQLIGRFMRDTLGLSYDIFKQAF